MKTVLTLAAILIFNISFQSFAQRHDFHSPSRVKLNPEDAQFEAEHFQSLMRRIFNGGPAAAQKTTSNGWRLTAEAYYDYSLAPGSQLEDSTIFKYSGTRSSQFDIKVLNYFFENISDLGDGNSHLDFDSAWSFDPAGSNNAVFYAARTYDSSGKVTRNEIPGDELITYTYNSAHQLSEAILKVPDSALGWKDRRHYYNFYNSKGQLVTDSIARFNGTIWYPYVVEKFTYDTSGRVIYVYEETAYFGPISPYFDFYISYLGASNLPNTLLSKVFDGNPTSSNAFLDTFGYLNGAMIYDDSYYWDTTSVWIRNYVERRHLNANNYPDSIFIQAWNSVGGDTTLTVLNYTARNNPLFKKLFTNANSTPTLSTEYRWHYEPSPTGVASVSTKPLEIYPNPVQDALYLKNLSGGNYKIHNSLGQIVQEGKCQKGIPVSMNYLTPGQYMLQVETSSGELYSGKVTKE
jgi:hypothetical protein